MVPKFNVNADGSLGERNGIHCGGLEHKMGIHGNATAQLVLENAVGTLVGEPNKGLAAMFVMMNAARLGVGMQSLGLTEVAYQNAVAYAKDRIQMRALSGPKAPGPAGRPDHRAPRRAQDAADRACLRRRRPRARDVDDAACSTRRSPPTTPTSARDCADLVALVTPIVKAFLTDNAWIATSHCLQVFGGHGYIREWGMEQFVRDARINMIYEGTNTIQSLDLLGRKVLGDNGAKLKKFGKLIAASSSRRRASNEAMQEFVNPLADLGDKVTKLTTELGMKALRQRRRGGRRRGRLPARLRPPGVRLLLGAHGQGRAAPSVRPRRSVLQGQARDRALLLRQAAARDGRPDPHRARRRWRR